MCASGCTRATPTCLHRFTLYSTLSVLLQDLDSGVRVGDVYALMIEYWYEQRNMQEAYKLVEQMRGRNIIISPYLDQRMVEDIYKVWGKSGGGERWEGRGSCALYPWDGV